MRFSDSVARSMAQLAEDLERHRLAFLLVFSLLYWLGTCGLALWTPLWYDELFTFHFSRLPSVSAIWSALAAADDLNPPLTYLLTRASHTLFGEGQLATRLPAMVGFWVLCLCLFQFVARRCGGLFGALAMLAIFMTKAPGYAYEARPYGVALACTGLALVFWQSCTEGRRRALSLAGLTLAVGGGGSSHYWATLIVLPLAAGELVRSIPRRKIDWPVWLSMVLGFVPLYFYLPGLRAARAYVVPVISEPQFSSIPESYEFFLQAAFWPLMGLLVLAAIAPAFRPRDAEHASDGSRALPPRHDVVAALVLAALPVVVVLLAKLAKAGVQPRYAIYSVAGVSLLTALSIRFGARRGSARPGLAFLLFFGVFGFQQVWLGLLLAAKAPRPFQTLPIELAQGERNLPVVASTPNLFLQLAHYAPPDLAARVYYLSDTKIAMERVHTNTWELGLDRLRRWTPLQIADYRAFVSSNGKFLVYGPYLGVWDWVVPQLIEDGARVELRGRAGQDFMFLVNTERVKH